MKGRRQPAIALVVATAAALASDMAAAQGRASAAEKDAFRAGVATCLRGPDTGLRQCLQKLLPSRDEQQSTSPAPDSKWQSGVSTDKLDGSTTVGLALTSSDGISGVFGIKKEATLLARCVNNKTEVFVNWPEFIGIGNSKEVKWRVDAQPVAVEWWTPSVNGQAVFSPAAIPFLKRLVGGRELILSVGAYNKLPESLSFPISGAESAIRPIREACKW